MALQAQPIRTSRALETPVSRWSRAHLEACCAAAGLTLDGPARRDPQIRHERAIGRILLHGSLGAGESYVDGEWDADALDETTERLLRAGSTWLWHRHSAWQTAHTVAARVVNLQSHVRARANVAAHYDLGNDLYEAMLGPTLTYSCGYWRDATTLDEAQNAKHDLIARKIGLAAGDHVLDIGCGWGGFARFAAEQYGARVTGITLSAPQAALARARTAGLPVEIRVQDYRTLQGRFDHVVSIGMFEHVGPRNYSTFFDTVTRLVDPDGLVLLHTIGGSVSGRTTDPWIDRYIFPNSVLPSAAQIAEAVEGRLVIEDWQNFGADYDRTLMAWHERLTRAWPALSRRYDARFRRLWRYYLLTCAGTFRARVNQLWQLVLSPGGVPGGWTRWRLP